MRRVNKDTFYDARHSFAAARLGKKIVLIGGYDEKYNEVDTISTSVDEGYSWVNTQLDEDDKNIVFKVFNKNLDWTKALEHCKNLGGDLASIHSDEENTAIKNLLSKNSACRDVLLGLYYENDGTFRWSDSTPFD